MQLASLTYIGGFVVKQLQKEIECILCCQLVSKEKCSSPMMDLIYKRDISDKMHYPSEMLVWLLSTIFEFVCEAAKLVTVRTCETLTKLILPVLSESPLLKCPASLDDSHIQSLSMFVCKCAIPIFLKNIASETTERFERVKFLNSKPTSRKILRV